MLLFDLDGTLVRTHGAGMRAMDRAFLDQFGWSRALATLSPAGRTDPFIAQTVSRAMIGRSLTDAELNGFFSLYLRYLQEELDTAPRYEVLPGIQTFLERWSEVPGVWLGLGTGNLEVGARLKLERGGLNRFLPFGGFGSDSQDRSELLRIAVERGSARAGRRFPQEQVVVVGDTPHDLSAARALGVRALLVATGPYATEDLAAEQPDAVVSSFAESTVVHSFLEALRA